MTHDNKMVKLKSNEFELSDEAISKLDSLIKNNQQTINIINQQDLRDYSIKIPKSIDRKTWQKFTQDINLIKNDEFVNEHVHSQVAQNDTLKDIKNKISNISNKTSSVISNNKIISNKIIRQECSF
jgi:predicted transcriptional regulator